MSKKKDRLGYGINPPYINFKESIQIVKKLYEDAGESVSEDQLSAIIGNSVQSSSFTRKVLALKNFGLIASNGNRIEITVLGRNIVAPISEEGKQQALKSAFLSVGIYAQLHQLWAGKLLPTDEFFINTLRERCAIPPVLTKQWKDSFMASGQAAGMFQDRSDGRIQMRMESAGRTVEMSENGPEDEAARPQEGLSRSIMTTPEPEKRPQTPGMERYQIALREGKKAYVELSEGWTEGDIKKLVRVITVMFSETEGQ